MAKQTPSVQEKPIHTIEGIRVLPNKGPSEVLIIAPHGPIVKSEPKDDERTGIIAEEIHKITGWFTIINDVYVKPEKKDGWSRDKKILDLNQYKQAMEVPGYLETIKEAIAENDGRTLVIWLHGMDDESANDKSKYIASEAATADKEKIDALIGYGQGVFDGDTDSRLSARETTVSALKKALSNSSMGAFITKEDARNFRGRDPERMNQWFLEQGYALDKVESIQIEIRKDGFRETPKQCKRTAKILSKAIKELTSPSEKQEPSNREKTVKAMPAEVQSADESSLVNETFAYLKDIFRKHFHEAMLEAGEYIIKMFYAGNYEAAREKKPVYKDSLHKLILRLKENAGDAPSKTWVYDAVNLAVDKQALSDFAPYEKVGHSHKVLLTHIADMERKKGLIEEIVENEYTVARFRERIKETIEDKRVYISAEKVPDNDTLETLPPRKLVSLCEEIEKRIGLYKEKITQFEADKTRVKQVIDKKPVTNTKSRSGGFRDWTEKGRNINIQKGCQNDCLYCYAKEAAYRLKRIEPGKWTIENIRQAEVNKEHKLYGGLVEFPSTHDITPQNISDYMTVLGKLLSVGNSVLIVSKPRLKCVQKICDASHFFKDKILFRFTISANNDDILRFWEPNAPAYTERKEALQYAFENGFQTSVSIEPMLDSANLVSLVRDIEPLVNETICIGKMNHIKSFSKYIEEDNNPELETRLKQILEGQTKKRLDELHQALKENPKVKWKTKS